MRTRDEREAVRLLRQNRAVVSVRCPECKAAKGSACRDLRGGERLLNPHAGRLAADRRTGK